ncbi:MAG TPA: DUF1844 domain-containing protein [Terriglobales bacterium]|jgi:hypothetical protein|nr:DUF1844 domain-containing protein [Terriglobales bacterium]
MSEKKTENFTVTDRRLFTSEGDLRSEASEEESPAPASTATPVQPEPPAPPAPSADEQQQQADAYAKSARDLDRQVELSGNSAQDLEITFERFLASLYMTGMLQLGLMHEQGGQPGLDLIGARQTIDTIGLLADKTKGNLTPKEQNFLQNALYELRMAYVEVTNAIARGPQQAPPSR